MDQLAENPLQFMQDWAALTAPSSEQVCLLFSLFTHIFLTFFLQRDPRLQRAIDAYGVLELRERLAREAENVSPLLIISIYFLFIYLRLPSCFPLLRLWVNGGLG